MNFYRTIKAYTGYLIQTATNAVTIKSVTQTVGDSTANLPNLQGSTDTFLLANTAAVVTSKDIDGGTASNSSRLTVPKDTKANLDTLTRKEGTLVYASDLNTLFADDGSNLQPVGSGSGGGGVKNYMLNPSAATSSATNWTAANFTVTRDTSTAIPRETTTGTAFKLVSTAGSSTATFLSDAILLDDADLSKKLAVELAIAINAADSSQWSIDILNSATSGGSYVRIPLPTDVAAVTYLPATTGVFQTSVDMTAALPYVKFRITCKDTAKTAYFSDILLSPDKKTVVGSVVGAWLSYTPTLNSDTGVAFKTGRYRRVGDSLELQGYVSYSSGGASGVFTFGLPTGLTINTASLVNVSNAGDESGFWYDQSTNSQFSLIIDKGYSTTAIALRSGGGGSLANIPSTSFGGSNDVVQIHCTVPISEWPNGTVNLAQNDVEYAYNTSSATTGNDTSSFGYGPSGVPIYGYTVSLKRRVRFQSPIQPTDTLTLEIKSSAAGPWIQVRPWDTNGVQSLTFFNGTSYGLALDQTFLNSTDIDVYFGSYAYASGATYGAAGTAWASYTAYSWRVRKTSAGAAVGFGNYNPGVSAGLVPSAGLPGRTDGNLPASGYIGEILQARSAFTPTSGAYVTTSAVLNLPVGIWEVASNVQFSSAGVTVTRVYANVSINPVNDTAVTAAVSGLTLSDNVDSLVISFSQLTLSLPQVIIKSDGSNLFYYDNGSFTQYRTGTLLYVKAFLGTFSGNPTAGVNIAQIKARRIA